MDRAVSDVLGYILIFALITSSVGVVTVAGFGTLADTRDAERFENAERVFDILGANVADHLEDRVRTRNTEIRLADSSLGFGDPVGINVTVGGVGSNSTTVEPLLYSQGETARIAYTGGAVVRSKGGSAVMTAGPPFRFGNRTVITMVNTRGRDTGVAGSARVLVRTELVSQSVYEYTNGPYTVTLNVTPPAPRSAAWAQWLESETGTDCDTLDDTVSCTFEADEVYVRTVTIDVFLVD
jgi:hypothetical protein